MEFKEKLIALRRGCAMTQTQLAEALGVTRQSVYKWEAGQSFPEAMTLFAMRGLFGVSLDALLDPAVTANDILDMAEGSDRPTAAEIHQAGQSHFCRATDAGRANKADTAGATAKETDGATPEKQASPEQETQQTKQETAPAGVAHPAEQETGSVTDDGGQNEIAQEKPKKKEGFFARLFH